MGADLYQNKTIYLINSSFKKNEQRIDSFDLSLSNDKVKAKFVKSISFGKDYFLKQNNLHVTSPNHFYVSQFTPDGAAFPKDG